MTKVLFIGGPHHNQVQDIPNPSRPVRYAERNPATPVIADKPTTPWNTDVLFKVEEYIPQEVHLFGVTLRVQVAPDYYVFMQDYLRDKCMKALGF